MHVKAPADRYSKKARNGLPSSHREINRERSLIAGVCHPIMVGPDKARGGINLSGA